MESDKPLWSQTNLFGVKSDKLCGVSQTLWSRTNLFGVKSDNSLWSQSNSVESDKPLWSWLVSAILSVKLTRSTGDYRSTSNIDNTKLYVNYCIFFFYYNFLFKSFKLKCLRFKVFEAFVSYMYLVATVPYPSRIY